MHCVEPVLAGQIYDPYTTRQVNATCAVPNADPNKAIAVGQLVWIRDPIAGNNLANSVNGIDPVGQALVNFYPQPNANTSSGNWAASGLGGNNSDEYSARIDHNFSDSTRLYGRYSYKKEFKDVSPAYFGSDNPAGPGQRNPNNRYNIGIGVSHVFSPTFTMSANFGLMHWVEGNDVQSNGFQVSSLGLPAFIDPISPEYPVIAAVRLPRSGATTGSWTRRISTGRYQWLSGLCQGSWEAPVDIWIHGGGSG